MTQPEPPLTDQPRHVIKFSYDDGKELAQPIAWCGDKLQRNQWMFLDAQHCLLSLARDAITPCPRCLAAMRNVIDDELARQETLV